jgi:hypothetical protein
VSRKTHDAPYILTVPCFAYCKIKLRFLKSKNPYTIS